LLTRSRWQLNYNTKLFRFGLPSEEQRLDMPITSCLVTRAQIDGEEVVRPYTPVSEADAKGPSASQLNFTQ